MKVNRSRTDARGMTGGSPGRRALVVLLSLALATSTSIVGLSLVSADTSQIPNDVGHGILGFEAKRSIAIHNNDTVLEDTRVPVVFDTAQEIADGDLEPDCSDLRFTPETTPSQSLAFWLDPATCGDTDTTIWVHVPSIPASEDGPEVELTMFYGEPALDAGPRAQSVDDRVDNLNLNLGSEISLLGSSDGDEDGVSDTLEETLCARPVENELVFDTTSRTGDCESISPANYTPTGDETWLISPSLVHAGEDRDGDGVPATVNLSYTNITLNTTEADPVDVRFGGTIQEKLDLNDTDPTLPATDTPCTTIEAPRGTTSLVKGPDEDGDGVPQNVWVSRGKLCVDPDDGTVDIDPVTFQMSPQLDPDDFDPTVPAGDVITAETVARNATFSLDEDGDRLPCRGFVGFVDVTFHRDDHDWSTNAWTQSIAYDADCSDPDQPTEGPDVDLDLDGIPQRLEPFICERQLETTSLDGTCSDLGTNYHPPSAYFHAVAPQDDPIEP